MICMASVLPCCTGTHQTVALGAAPLPGLPNLLTRCCAAARDGDAGVTKYLGLLAPKLQQRSEQLWAYLEPHARAPFFCELLSQLAGMLGGSEAQKQVSRGWWLAAEAWLKTGHVTLCLV